ncbi:RNA-binding protein 47-like [Oppia nitens]|uniref:RNA-binding protein 47-like n=1 Tax=Oppia nitens TaxID=1686743 RepID=UPI0023D99533|nr:RNA-binding protein 47-like [Oppia nitens]
MSGNISKEQKLLDLIERSGFNIVQENGQRVFGPPPDWPSNQPPPQKGCEVFVGKIPRDCYEDELVPLLTRIGPIYQLRLMMDFSGTNRGYAFATYINQSDANKAIKQLNNIEIRENKRIGVVQSLDNCRLFIGNIPLNKTRQDVMQELSKETDGVVNAIVYNNYNKVEKQYKNRGFAFVEYKTHRDAAMARRKLLPGKIKLFDCEISVDWAVPETNVDEEIMSKVMVLFVRHLSIECSEDMIKNVFSLKGSQKVNVQKVKKIKNYAFVHYFTREDAEMSLKSLTQSDLRATGLTDEGQQLEITWAKPPNAANTFQRRKKRYYGLGNSGGDGINTKTYSPNTGALMNTMASQFDYNTNKQFTPNIYSSLMSGDSNNWTIRNSSPSIAMTGLRMNGRNSINMANTNPNSNHTPIWYPIERQYPWLPPIGVVRSPQTIGVFRSPQPYNVFH